MSVKAAKIHSLGVVWESQNAATAAKSCIFNGSKAPKAQTTCTNPAPQESTPPAAAVGTSQPDIQLADSITYVNTVHQNARGSLNC
jgi:hypothetical protein